MRLQRVGRRNQASFRIVVVDSRTGPKSNKYTDLVGHHDPAQDRTHIDADRARGWLAQGVQPTDTVHNLLVSKGVVDAPKRNALPKKHAPAAAVDERAGDDSDQAASSEAAEAETEATEATATA